LVLQTIGAAGRLFCSRRSAAFFSTADFVIFRDT